MIKLKENSDGSVSPILVCDVCGEQLGRLFIAVYGAWEPDRKGQVDVRTLCVLCDNKEGTRNPWEDGVSFIQKLILNTKSRPSKSLKDYNL